jgi:Holliday junction resolvasome RuvABC DNA-binding subunit
MFRDATLNAAQETDQAMEDQRETLLESIIKIKEEMVSLGYSPSEIEYFIQKVSTKKLNQLDVEELQLVQIALRRHLDIAQKCMNVL